MDTDTLDVSPPCNWRSVSRLSSVPRCSVPVAPTGRAGSITRYSVPSPLLRPRGLSVGESLRREHRYTRRGTWYFRRGRRPPDSDGVPKKCITNPPGYHRDPVVRRPPTTNVILPRLAPNLSSICTRAWCFSTIRAAYTRRRLDPSETTVDYAEPTIANRPIPRFGRNSGRTDLRTDSGLDTATDRGNGSLTTGPSRLWRLLQGEYSRSLRT